MSGRPGLIYQRLARGGVIRVAHWVSAFNFRRRRLNVPDSVLNSIRADRNAVAFLFVHGYSGNLEATWGEFPSFLKQEPRLHGWDIFSLGYTTSLYPDLRNLWSAKPSIVTLADLFRTHLSYGTLTRYRQVAVLAHSMGGLLVQRAILDDANILDRTSHVFLFGTPSDGLRKAAWFKFWSRQVQDLGRDSELMQDLRARRSAVFANPRFEFATIAGDTDDFVPRESSLDPFERRFHRVVPGNHIEIVKPMNATSVGVQVVIDTITGNAAASGPWSAERVAVERGEFHQAIAKLEPAAARLDPHALVQLALAMEECGRSADALHLLERYGGSHTDPKGVLAGRLKRRWQHERRKEDGTRAREIYAEAYDVAAAAPEPDDPQAFYMAINVAFMELALDPASPAARQRSEAWATKALDHTQRSPADKWRMATEGEANLILGKPDVALRSYRMAIALQPTPRELSSMFQQAYHIADLLYPPAPGGSDPMADRLDELFRPSDDHKPSASRH
jgi:pimeloyl-ACP methyl ester carboxylesterase